MNKFLYLLLLLPVLDCCSPKIRSSITSKQTPLADTAFVLVLQKEDDFTNDGVDIGTIKSGDNGLSTNCTYYEVIDKLKALARQNGANVIKITAYKSPDHFSSCVRLTANIYLVPNFRKHEKEIEWSADRKLTWEDFKGTPKLFTKANVAAQTYCGFAFQTNYVTLFTKTKIFTKNTFDCDSSWVRPDQADRPDLLEHEQGHFDLCEVYARRLRKKLEEEKLMVYTVNTRANVIFKNITAQYLDRQELYEKETNYGLNRQKQMEWTATIHKEINELGYKE